MASKNSARFTEEHKSMLKEIIIGDKELRDHLVFQNVSSRDQQTTLWRRFIENFNTATDSNFTKEQISNCLSRLKRYEMGERQRRQDEGIEDMSDLWLTLDTQSGDIKNEIRTRNNPAHFSREDIEELKTIITGDNEIRGLIFHGTSMTNEQSSELWMRLVNKFNEVTGKSYNKNQIYRCLSRIKYKEKKQQSMPMSTEDDYSSPNQDYWNSNDNENYNDIDNSNSYTNGMENMFGLIKGEGLGDISSIMQQTQNSTFDSETADWSNPLATYLKAIMPGMLEEQRLKRKNLVLQNENLKLHNKKLKLDLKERM